MKLVFLVVLAISAALAGSAYASVSCSSMDRLGGKNCSALALPGTVLATYLWSDHRVPTQDDLSPIATYLWSD